MRGRRRGTYGFIGGGESEGRRVSARFPRLLIAMGVIVLAMRIRDSTCRHGAWLALLWLLPAAGCADNEQPLLAEYLSGVEVDVALESKAYVELGEFDVPLTIGHRARRGKQPVRMRLRLVLSAEADPNCKEAVQNAYDRHRGAINDAVVTLIRRSSADDLADPRLSAIKGRMFAAIRPLLGGEGVRQLVLNDIRTEAM
jgi:hypothetical protein